MGGFALLCWYHATAAQELPMVVCCAQAECAELLQVLTGPPHNPPTTVGLRSLTVQGGKRGCPRAVVSNPCTRLCSTDDHIADMRHSRVTCPSEPSQDHAHRGEG